MAAVWLGARRDLKLLRAVPRPGKILHTSINFRSHKEEVAAASGRRSGRRMTGARSTTSIRPVFCRRHLQPSEPTPR